MQTLPFLIFQSIGTLLVLMVLAFLASRLRLKREDAQLSWGTTPRGAALGRRTSGRGPNPRHAAYSVKMVVGLIDPR